MGLRKRSRAKMKKKIQPVMVRLDKEKYIKVRHELLDQGVTVNAFINRLIDEHLGARSDHQRGRETGRSVGECGA
jgi:hypothetical protein